MKKIKNSNIFKVILSILVIIVSLVVSEYSGRKNEILDYLEGRYDKEFVISSKVSEEYLKSNERVIYAYYVYPKDEPKNTFVAGKTEPSMYHPFIPPFMSYEYFDEYK